MSNAEEYRRTRRSMSVVGIPEGEQEAVFRTVAAVLHLGNVEFAEATVDGGEGSAVAPAAEEHLAAAAALLGVDPEGLRKALTTRTRHTPDGAIVSPIDVPAAEDNRDALAKTLYSRTFDWLVDKINTSIGQDPGAASLIGVLDIYGARRGEGPRARTVRQQGCAQAHDEDITLCRQAEAGAPPQAVQAQGPCRPPGQAALMVLPRCSAQQWNGRPC